MLLTAPLHGDIVLVIIDNDIKVFCSTSVENTADYMK